MYNSIGFVYVFIWWTETIVVKLERGGRKNKQRGREREKKKILLPQKRNIVQSERERESHN